MLKLRFRTVLSKLSLPLWLAIVLSAAVPVLAAQQHRANIEASAIGDQAQITQQDHTLDFGQASYSVSEGAGSLEVTVVLSAPYTETTTVTVEYSTGDDTATAGADYTSTSGQLTFPPNTTIDTFTVPILEDAIDEGDETFTLTLSDAQNADIAASGTVTVIIIDNDAAGFDVSPTSGLVVAEGGATDAFDINLTSEPLFDVTINLFTGSQCTAAPTSLTFTGDDWGVAQTVTVTAVDDQVAETGQSCTVTGNASSSDGKYVGAIPSVNVTVQDNDTADVQVSPTSFSVAEGASSSFTIGLTSQPLSNVMIDLTAGPECSVDPTSVTFNAGDWETPKNIQVTGTEDGISDGNQQCLITTAAATSDPGYSNVPVDNVQVNVIDGDPVPAVQFSRDAYSVNEGGGLATITVELTTPSAVTISVNVEDIVGGTATAGVDYTAVNETVEFAPEEETATFNVTITNDALHEDDETVTLQLSSPSPSGSVTLGTPSTATLTIVDNDAEPTVHFSSSTYSIGEGADADSVRTITVLLDGRSSKEISVDYTTSDGSATAGSDYEPASGTLVFPAGTTTGTSRTFDVIIKHDIESEPTETVNLTLSNPVNSSLTNPSSATLFILDNDEPPTVQFSSATYFVNEGAGTATVTVNLSGPSSSPVTVNYATVSGGTATPVADYIPTSGTLVFSPGQTSMTFNIIIVDDIADDDNETINLALSNPVPPAVELGDPSTSVLTITDNDGQPSVQFDSASYDVAENVLTATITVTLSAPSISPISVTYATADGTATAGEDYLNSTGTVTFAANQTVQTFSVPIFRDQVDEPDETVILTLSAPVNADLGQPSTATLTILDNDPPPILSFAVSNLTVGENEGFANLVVRLDAASARPVTIDYSTLDGTAEAGSDYTATTGTLQFAPGETTKTINVPIAEDKEDESDETFAAILKNPVNATLGTPDAVSVTIVDGELVRFMRFFPFGSYLSLGEPNNECAQAYEIMLSQSYLFAPDDLFDWYYVTLTEPGKLTVTVNNFVPSSGQIVVGMGTSCTDATTKAQIGSPQTNNTIELEDSEPGIYYIIVTNDDEPTFQPYELTVRFEAE